jgi:TolB-like protein
MPSSGLTGNRIGRNVAPDAGGEMSGSRWLPIALAALALAPAAAKVVKVAVLEIRALGTEASRAELLSEVALTEAASMRGFDVIGKSDINSIIGFEKQKQVIGCSDDSTCLAEVGGALGVDFILVGSLGRIGSLYRIDLKLVETRKARVRGRIGVSVDGQEEKLVVAIQKAVRDLLLPETPADEPVAAVVAPTKEQRADPKLAPRADKGARTAERRTVAPTPPPPSDGKARSGGSSRRTWAYVAGGAGLAAVAGGVVAGLSAKAAFDDEKAASAAGDLAAYEDYKSKAQTLPLVADGLYVVGAAGIGVGAWLYFTGKEPAVAFDVVPLPGGAMATIGGGF